MPSEKTKKNSLGEDALNTILQPFFRNSTRAVLHPFKHVGKEDKAPPPFHIQVYDYTKDHIHAHECKTPNDVFHYKKTDSITWLNLEGIHKKEVEELAQHFNIHPLIQEDILSYGQRPKFDEVRDIIFVLMNMLFYDAKTQTIEQEQISIVLGENLILSFQEDARRDVFDPIRQKLKIGGTKLRLYPADYLLYSMIDLIVDSYFSVIEKIGESIEQAEEGLVRSNNKHVFQKINLIRKNLILLKRNTTPVRDLISAILRSDNHLLDDNTTKYYKDVYDHIMQANDLADNYRELVNTLQDMYFNNVNLRMNEVMKTLAILTTIMAPATVIGGIFGMNFDIIPYAHHKWGFYGTVLTMMVIPLLMMIWFKKRGWFKKESRATEY
jgi:magnesium transporter